MRIFKFITVIAQDASPTHFNEGSSMGVFEFVLAIIFMSLLFKTINLRFESQKNNQTRGEANSLGLNSAMDMQEQRASKEKAAKGASRKTTNPSSRWLILCLMALCFIPMAFFLLGSLSYQPAAMPTVPAVPLEIHQLPEAPAISEAVPVPPNATPWERELNETPDEFLADVYPSIVDCGAPMAIKIYNEISDRLPTVSRGQAEDPGDEKDEDNQNKIAEQETPEPTEFYIANGGLSEQDYIPFVVAFRKKIQAKIKNSSVREVSGQVTDYLKPPKSHYRIFVDRLPKVINGEDVYTAGQVVCKVKAKDLSTEVLTTYVQKLWLTDFDAYSKQNPGRQFAVGRDDGFYPNQSQAREQALKNAGRTVDSVGGTQYAINGRTFNLIDEACQKYERPYGDVFRCSVLLAHGQDTSVDMVSATVMETRQPTLLSSLFNCGWKPSFEWSIALLIGLTVVIGTISNVLTQGYYRTEISSSMMVAVLVGFCILIAIVISTIG